MTTLNRLTAAAAVAAVALPLAAHPAEAAIVQTNLVSNQAGVANVTDPNLVNPWGIAFAPNDAFWFSDEGSGLSTLYDGQGNIVPLVVTVPAAAGQPKGTPTGIIWNPTTANPAPSFEMAVPGSTATTPAVFVYASEDGTISGWAPSVNLNASVIVADNSASGAVYKGLAFGTNTSGAFLFATNFHAGTVDVYDTNFHLTTLPGNFSDPSIPSTFAPFGIANIDGDLYVTYAKQDAAKHNDVPGVGHGFVDVFNTSGQLIRQFAARGTLNSPWGIVQAPAGFGMYGGQILIGNFGNGHLLSYPIKGGAMTGPVLNQSGTPLVIPGLWGLATGTAESANPDAIYFTAGANQGSGGLFGSLAAVKATSSPAPTPSPTPSPAPSPSPSPMPY